MVNQPPKHLGLHHLALKVANMDTMQKFYCELLQFEFEWQPDPDNLYLTSGTDSLALHRVEPKPESEKGSLDHLGLVVASEKDIEIWHSFLVSKNVPIATEPKRHRDGACSFYFLDPEGNKIQLIYHPPLSPKLSP